MKKATLPLLLTGAIAIGCGSSEEQPTRVQRASVTPTTQVLERQQEASPLEQIQGQWLLSREYQFHRGEGVETNSYNSDQVYVINAEKVWLINGFYDRQTQIISGFGSRKEIIQTDDWMIDRVTQNEEPGFTRIYVKREGREGRGQYIEINETTGRCNDAISGYNMHTAERLQRNIPETTYNN